MKLPQDLFFFALIIVGAAFLYIESNIPSHYTSADAVVVSHHRRYTSKGDTVANVTFSDINHFHGKIPLTLETKDPVIWGWPAVGEHVKIWYDPKEPGRARLDNLINRRSTLIFGSAAAFTIWIVMIVRKRLKRPKAPKLLSPAS